MDEKLNITFVKGTRELLFDIETPGKVMRGQIMVNGWGPFYWATRDTGALGLDKAFFDKVKELVRKEEENHKKVKRGKK